MPKRASDERQFEYLFNRVERAAQASDPSKAGYGEHRKNLFAYVQSLEEQSLLCDNCRSPKQAHRLANYADGPNIGEAVLVCPTATFL